MRVIFTPFGRRENLTAPTSVESRVGAQRGLAPDERLACQAVVNGNVTVTTAYW